MDEFARIVEFERIIRSAFERKYASTPELLEGIMGEIRFGGWNATPFAAAYRSGGAYPEDRLLGCLYHIVDVKLQIYFIIEVDLGLYNTQIFDRGFDEQNPLASPDLFLRHLSFDQTLIVKSRILWERIMNFVYFLETGELLERRASGRRSKRKVFFEFVEAHPQWRFLGPYGSELDEFESTYRGPEVHKASTLRAHVIAGKTPNHNDLLKPLNRAINVIWQNVMSIVAGQPPSAFTDLHVSPNGSTIDPKYTPGSSKPPAN